MPDDMVVFLVVFLGVGALAAAFLRRARLLTSRRRDFARRCCLQERPRFKIEQIMVAPYGSSKS